MTDDEYKAEVMRLWQAAEKHEGDRSAILRRQGVHSAICVAMCVVQTAALLGLLWYVAEIAAYLWK